MSSKKSSPKKSSPRVPAPATTAPPKLAEHHHHHEDAVDIPSSPPVEPMVMDKSGGAGSRSASPVRGRKLKRTADSTVRPPRSLSPSPVPTPSSSSSSSSSSTNRKRPLPADPVVPTPSRKKSKEADDDDEEFKVDEVDHEEEDPTTDEGEPEDEEEEEELEEEEEMPEDEEEEDEEDPEADYLTGSEDDPEEEGMVDGELPVKKSPPATTTVPPPPSTSSSTTPIIIDLKSTTHVGVIKPNECQRCRLIVPGADEHFMRKFAPKFYETACSPAFNDQLKQMGMPYSPKFLCDGCCEAGLKPVNQRSSHRREGPHTVVLTRIEQNTVRVQSYLKKDQAYATPSEWHVHHLATLLRAGTRLEWKQAKEKAAEYYEKYYKPMCAEDPSAPSSTPNSSKKSVGIPMFPLRPPSLPSPDDEKRVNEYLYCQNGMRYVLARCFPDRKTLFAPLDRQHLVDYLRLIKQNSARKNASPDHAGKGQSPSASASGGRQRNRGGRRQLLSAEQKSHIIEHADTDLNSLVDIFCPVEVADITQYVHNVLIPSHFKLKPGVSHHHSPDQPITDHLSVYELNPRGLPIFAKPITLSQLVAQLHQAKPALSKDDFGVLFMADRHKEVLSFFEIASKDREHAHPSTA